MGVARTLSSVYIQNPHLSERWTGQPWPTRLRIVSIARIITVPHRWEPQGVTLRLSTGAYREVPASRCVAAYELSEMPQEGVSRSD